MHNASIFMYRCLLDNDAVYPRKQRPAFEEINLHLKKEGVTDDLNH